MIEKDSIELKPKKWKLIIAIALACIWGISVVISYTPLVQYYWINFSVVLVMQNSMNILIFVIILSVLYTAEKRMLEQKINDYERKMNNGNRR